MPTKSVSSELQSLAKTLADWSAGTSFTVYVFGSRVRGDYRLDSDVDVILQINQATDSDVDWWTRQNEENFASINSRLPGPLNILELKDPVADKVRAAAVAPFYVDRNVICVWLPPKKSVRGAANSRSTLLRN